MATYCPKCGYKLSMVDVKPECPVCGVNLVYYGMEDTLKKEADKAEFEHATFQPHIDRLKAATIGSKTSIARLVICFLPLIATLIPMGKVVVNLPFYTETITVNIISVITKVFMNLDFDFLITMASSPNVGTAYIFYLIAVVCFVLVMLMSLLNLVNLFMACGKRGLKRNITVASLGLAFTVVGGVAMEVWMNLLGKAMPEIFQGSGFPWGVIAVALMFCAEIAINVIYKKKAIKIKYTDVSQYLISFDERQKNKDEETVQLATE